MYEVGGVTAGELAFEFACDGEGWRDDGFADVESCAEALCEGGFSCAEWPERSMTSPPWVRCATCLPSSRMASPVVASTVTVLAVPSLVFSLASVMVASLMLVGSSFAADQFDGSF